MRPQILKTVDQITLGIFMALIEDVDLLPSLRVIGSLIETICSNDERLGLPRLLLKLIGVLKHSKSFSSIFTLLAEIHCTNLYKIVKDETI